MDVLYKKRAQWQLETPKIQLVFSSARPKATTGCAILTVFT